MQAMVCGAFLYGRCLVWKKENIACMSACQDIHFSFCEKNLIPVLWVVCELQYIIFYCLGGGVDGRFLFIECFALTVPRVR